MAVSTSPYVQNDYQSANTFRPYQLPVNDIFKSLVAQNQYWDQGAQKIKSVYDQLSSQELTIDENKKYRDEYLKIARSELSKMSSMNLADPSVQRMGLNVFSNLTSDKAIQLDSYLTKQKNNIISEAQSYKKKKIYKDGFEGEGYNDENLMYALDGFEELKPDMGRDLNKLQSIQDKVKNNSYIPFYDYSSELLALKEKCNPDETQSSIGNGFALQSSSLTSTQLMGCLKTGLSKQAWKQIEISGYLRLKSDLPKTAQMYIPTLSANNREYALQMQQIKNQMEEDRKKGTLDQVKEKGYTDVIKSLEDQINQNNTDIDQFSKGDYRKLTSNLKSIASTIYGDLVLSNYARGNSYVKEKNVKDEVYFAQQELEQKNISNQIALLNAVQKDGITVSTEFISQLYAKLGIPISSPQVQGLNAGIEMNAASTALSIEEDFNKANEKANNSILGVYNEVKSSLTDPTEIKAFEIIAKKQDGTLDFDAMRKYIQEHPSLINSTQNSLRGILNNAEMDYGEKLKIFKVKQQVEQGLESDPELKKQKDELSRKLDEKLPKLGTVVYYHPTKNEYVFIEPSRMKNILLGKDNEFKMKRSSRVASFVGDIGVGGSIIDARIPDLYSSDGTELVNYQNKITNLGSVIGSWFGADNRMNPKNKDEFKARQQRGEKLNIQDLRSTLPLDNILEDIEKFNEKASIKLKELTNKFVQSPSFDINSTPGAIYNMKSAMVSAIPMLSGEEYVIKAAGTKPGNNNETLAEVSVLKKNPKTKELETVNVRELFNDNPPSFSTNDPLSNIVLTRDKVYIKTNLNLYNNQSRVKNLVDYQLAALEGVALQNRQRKNLEIMTLPDGNSIGISVYGGENNSKSFRVFLKGKNGNIQIIPNYAETSDINQISNFLEEAISMYNKAK